MQIYYTPSTSWTVLADSAFVVDEITNTLYQFEGVLKDLWVLIEDNSQLDAIINKLLSMYDIDKKTLEEDVMDILKTLEHKNLIERK